MSARRVPIKDTHIRVEIDDRTPPDEGLSVVVFQETEVPQRSSKSMVTICTAWKVFSDLHGQTVAFKYPAATGLQAEITIPGQSEPTVVRVEEISRGSKWLLVETTPIDDVGEETEDSTPTFEIREGIEN